MRGPNGLSARILHFHRIARRRVSAIRHVA